jgi:hypothetical protein
MMQPPDIDRELFNRLNILSDSAEVAFRGVNLLDILRNDLGQKIARAMRSGQDSSRFDPGYEFSPEFSESRRRFWRELSGDIKKLAGGALGEVAGKADGRKKIFFQQSTKLRALAESFSAREDLLTLSNKRNFATNVQWVGVPSTQDLLRSWQEARRYAAEIDKLLCAQDVPLLEQDRARLPDDVFNGIFLVNQACRLLDTYPIDLVVTAGDNFLSPLALVLVAKQRGIPTLCLQHGLDCERFFHEQIYSDALCVWGESRAERCRTFSRHQPAEIHVTGCPQFDAIRVEVVPGDPTRDWLWLTRPHAPDKCYEPSRWPDEGTAIFATLLEALRDCPSATLSVKAHPRDDTRPYRKAAAAAGLAERVRFVEGRGGVMELIRPAGLVFSEDSTSGMEAMFCGKPLVHTHFAAAPPSLPFVDYAAALPAFDTGQLKGSVATIIARDEASRGAMLSAQKRFLDDYAGPLDGQALPRILQVIEGLL